MAPFPSGRQKIARLPPGTLLVHVSHQKETPSKLEDFSFTFNKQSVRLNEYMVNNSRAYQSGGKGGIPMFDSHFEHVYKAGHFPTSINVPFT
jgi:hypothetical protein